MEKLTKVFVVTDQIFFRLGLVTILRQLPHITVMGQAENGEELLKSLNPPYPDLILLDYFMQGINSIELTKIIKKIHPNIKVVLMTDADNEEFITSFFYAGANSYILKTASPRQAEKVISKVMRDGFYYTTHVHDILQTKLFQQKQQDLKYDEQPLSKREIEILKMICEEYTNKEIAAHLHISERTVDGHRLRILGKVGAKNTVGLVKFAIRKGFVSSKI